MNIAAASAAIVLALSGVAPAAAAPPRSDFSGVAVDGAGKPRAAARPPAAAPSIAALERRLAARPNDVDAIHALAAALLDRVRAGNDRRDLERADRLIERALKAAPENPASHTLDARRLMVAHRFNDALAAAAKAETLGASDVATDATKADALTELGRYDEAGAVIQTLLDNHYGPAALSRAAHFRFLHGDPDGAIELVERSLGDRRLPPFDQAWLRLQLAELLIHRGDFEAARQATIAAESAAPAATLALRARIVAAQGRPAEAAALLQRAIELQLRPEYAVELWRLAVRRGDLAAARRQGALLDGLARLDAAAGGLDRRTFAVWFADQDGRLADAEQLARAELAARPDIYSHDLLAWVLHRQGRDREAAPHAERAIALGTPDPLLRFHAGAILAALGDARGEPLIDAARRANPALGEGPSMAARR